MFITGEIAVVKKNQKNQKNQRQASLNPAREMLHSRWLSEEHYHRFPNNIPERWFRLGRFKLVV